MRLADRPVPVLAAEVRLWRLAGLLVAGCAVLGVLQALLWALIAPGEQVKVYTDGGYAALPTESTHKFMSIAMFAGIGLAVGLAVAVVTWAARSTRGGISVVALGLANAAGALTAYLIGPLIAPGTDPASVGAAAKESIVTAPPALTFLAIVAQPAIAVATYTFLALWSGTKDLEVPADCSTHDRTTVGGIPPRQQQHGSG